MICLQKDFAFTSVDFNDELRKYRLEAGEKCDMESANRNGQQKAANRAQLRPNRHRQVQC